MRIKIFGRIIYIPSWIKFAFIVLIFIVLGVVGYTIRKNQNILTENPDILISTSSPQPAESTSTLSPVQTTAPEITIYIIGCVANPSVVEIPFGSIVQDAVDAAGGLTEEADPTKINMAYPLSDHMMIKIPSANESDTDFIVNYTDWISTAYPSETKTPETDISVSVGIGKINLNTADKKMLCNLPGIGESTAQKIIDYRDKNGPFEYIEDIMKVPGIKQSRFESIKEMITV
ncbi:MAG: hypothetical protein E7384_03155 [Ruminococcaceae bacterium]|nr:hypothetical protein [Oscillospiraceae bacterium]